MRLETPAEVRLDIMVNLACRLRSGFKPFDGIFRRKHTGAWVRVTRAELPLVHSAAAMVGLRARHDGDGLINLRWSKRITLGLRVR